MHRLLHILPERLPTGTAKQIAMVCGALVRQGWQNAVCSFEHRGDARSHLPNFGAPLTFCPRPGSIDPSFFYRLRRTLATIRPEIVCTWGGSANTYGRLAVAAHRPITGVVCSVRDVRSSTNWFGRHLSRWLNRRTDHFLVNADHLVPTITDVSSERVSTVKNGVNLSSHLQLTRNARRDLDLSESVKLIAIVTDLVAERRIKNLIWGLDLLRVIHPQAHLLIIGDGPQAARLKQYSNRVHVDRCVHFLGRRTDVTELLAQCFCMWHGGGTGGCSNAVLEAMSVGLPVLAADTCCHRSIIEDRVHGFLIPQADPAAFARRTNQLLSDPGQAAQMGVHCRKRVETHFTSQRMTHEILQVMSKVMKMRTSLAA